MNTTSRINLAKIAFAVSGLALAGVASFSLTSPAQSLPGSGEFHALAIVPDFSVLVGGGSGDRRSTLSGATGKVKYEDITLTGGM
ncbi:hypothetical protein [Streptomyces sp. NPDC056069]|uniref:hypothetical protein n=1 Tax=Streptomyces sp. NPDC056069 TaxID=3345702 RepID=UPI0035E15D6A